jgi:hypothetical protein
MIIHCHQKTLYFHIDITENNCYTVSDITKKGRGHGKYNEHQASRDAEAEIEKDGKTTRVHSKPLSYSDFMGVVGEKRSGDLSRRSLTRG